MGDINSGIIPGRNYYRMEEEEEERTLAWWSQGLCLCYWSYLLINICLFSLPLYLKFHFIIHPLYHSQELSFLVVGASTPHGTNHHHLCPLHGTSGSGGTHSGQPRLTDKLECKASRLLAVARKIEINLGSPRTSQNRFRDTDLGYD